MDSNTSNANNWYRLFQLCSFYDLCFVDEMDIGNDITQFVHGKIECLCAEADDKEIEGKKRAGEKYLSHESITKS